MLHQSLATAAAALAFSALPALAQDEAPPLGETDPITSERELGTEPDPDAPDPDAVVDRIVEEGHRTEDGLIAPSTGAAEPTESWLGCPPDDELADACTDPEKPSQEALDSLQDEPGSSG